MSKKSKTQQRLGKRRLEHFVAVVLPKLRSVCDVEERTSFHFTLSKTTGFGEDLYRYEYYPTTQRLVNAETQEVFEAPADKVLALATQSFEGV